MNETPNRILVVDDEPSITEFVSYALKKEGFYTNVVDNGEDALALATKNSYDLFVLDIMLPGMDGYELCRRLRSKTTAPVLFLSARDTELDKVVGLEIGGDDYLAKPFGVRELIARVRALLRRGSGGDFPGANHRHHGQWHHARRGRPHGIGQQGRDRPHAARVRAVGQPHEERGQGGFARGPAARRLGLGILDGDQDRRHPHQATP